MGNGPTELSADDEAALQVAERLVRASIFNNVPDGAAAIRELFSHPQWIGRACVAWVDCVHVATGGDHGIPDGVLPDGELTEDEDWARRFALARFADDHDQVTEIYRELAPLPVADIKQRIVVLLALASSSLIAAAVVQGGGVVTWGTRPSPN